MMLAGFADHEKPSAELRERPHRMDEHVAWSVPPQAVAGLVDRATDWVDLSDPKPGAE